MLVRKGRRPPAHFSYAVEEPVGTFPTERTGLLGVSTLLSAVPGTLELVALGIGGGTVRSTVRLVPVGALRETQLFTTDAPPPGPLLSCAP